MKNLRPLSLLALAGLAATTFSACGTAYDTDNYGPSVSIEPSHNFFGIVKTTPNSFIAVKDTTVHLSSTEINAIRDHSGNNVSLFWGAITFTDY